MAPRVATRSPGTTGYSQPALSYGVLNYEPRSRLGRREWPEWQRWCFLLLVIGPATSAATFGFLSLLVLLWNT